MSLPVPAPAPDGRRWLRIVSGSSGVRTPAPLNHTVYAARHDLPYVFDVTPAPVAPITLQKLAVIRRHLAAGEWLFWLDDDAFFTNLATDLRDLVPVDPGIELAFCSSPVNPNGGWTWMSSGQLFIRNTPRMAALLEAVAGTDLEAVRRWWDPERHGLFTNGDQDAFVYHLERPDSPWAGTFQRLPWEAFNARPYHYESRLDEYFICHFAVPGRRSKMELIEEFAHRLGTTTALLDEAELEPFRTFVAHSPLGDLVRDPSAARPGPRTAARAPGGAKGLPGLVRRLARLPRRMVRRLRRRMGSGGPAA